MFMAMELIKENIEYEQLFGEKTIDTVVKEEYVIPDIQPDVRKILMVDAKPTITNKEIMQNKIYVEGQIKCNALYLANNDEESEVYNVMYTKDFSNYIEINGIQADMNCTAECYIEHMECTVINERKIAIEAIVQLKSSVYKKHEFEVVKNIEDLEDLQLLKNPSSMDKVMGMVRGDLISKAHIQVPMDKPEIGKILKCDVNVHKKEVKLLEGKVAMEAFTHIDIIYKAAGSRDIYRLEDDVFTSGEVDFEGIDYFMNSSSEFSVDDVVYDIKEDDLGESRIVDLEALVKCQTEVMYKAELDMIEDAYSPSRTLKMEKKNYQLNAMLGQNTCDTIIKENIELEDRTIRPTEVVMCSAKVCVTEKKIVEDKVLVEGLLNVDVLYKTSDKEKYVGKVSEEIPFSCVVEVPGAKIDMTCMSRVYLESTEAFVEANTIAVKGVASVYARVNYNTHREFLIDVIPVEDEVIEKKASIIIYVVQEGDTLWKVAKRYSSTVEDLMKINEIEDQDNIIVGEKMIIPGRAII